MAKAADKQRRIKASLLGHDTSRTETVELRVEADSLVVEEESGRVHQGPRPHIGQRSKHAKALSKVGARASVLEINEALIFLRYQ